MGLSKFHHPSIQLCFSMLLAFYRTYAISAAGFAVSPRRLFRVGWLLSDKNLNALKTSRYKTSPYLLEKN